MAQPSAGTGEAGSSHAPLVNFDLETESNNRSPPSVQAGSTTVPPVPSPPSQSLERPSHVLPAHSGHPQPQLHDEDLMSLSNNNAPVPQGIAVDATSDSPPASGRTGTGLTAAGSGGDFTRATSGSIVTVDGRPPLSPTHNRDRHSPSVSASTGANTAATTTHLGVSAASAVPAPGSPDTFSGGHQSLRGTAQGSPPSVRSPANVSLSAVDGPMPQPPMLPDLPAAESLMSLSAAASLLGGQTLRGVHDRPLITLAMHRPAGSQPQSAHGALAGSGSGDAAAAAAAQHRASVASLVTINSPPTGGGVPHVTSFTSQRSATSGDAAASARGGSARRRSDRSSRRRSSSDTLQSATQSGRRPSDNSVLTEPAQRRTHRPTPAEPTFGDYSGAGARALGAALQRQNEEQARRVAAAEAARIAADARQQMDAAAAAHQQRGAAGGGRRRSGGSRGGGGGPAAAGGSDPNSTNLYVEGFPPTMSADVMRLLFEEYGRVHSVRLAQSSNPPYRVYGMVLMGTSTEAQRAVEELNRRAFEESVLHVRFATRGPRAAPTAAAVQQRVAPVEAAAGEQRSSQPAPQAAGTQYGAARHQQAQAATTTPPTTQQHQQQAGAYYYVPAQQQQQQSASALYAAAPDPSGLLHHPHQTSVNPNHAVAALTLLVSQRNELFARLQAVDAEIQRYVATLAIAEVQQAQQQQDAQHQQYAAALQDYVRQVEVRETELRAQLQVVRQQQQQQHQQQQQVATAQTGAAAAAAAAAGAAADGGGAAFEEMSAEDIARFVAASITQIQPAAAQHHQVHHQHGVASPATASATSTPPPAHHQGVAASTLLRNVGGSSGSGASAAAGGGGGGGGGDDWTTIVTEEQLAAMASSSGDGTAGPSSSSARGGRGRPSS